MIGGFKSIPERIKSHIDAGTWSEAFITLRRNKLRRQKTEVNNLICIVIPLELNYTSGTRRGVDRRYRVGVYLMQAINEKNEEDETAREDELIKLLDEIEEHAGKLRKETPPIKVSTDLPRLPVDPEALEGKVFLAGFIMDAFDG